MAELIENGQFVVRAKVHQKIAIAILLLAKNNRFTRLAQRGFRTQEVYVVTTLTDALAYGREDVAALYYRRWAAEVQGRAQTWFVA